MRKRVRRPARARRGRTRRTRRGLALAAARSGQWFATPPPAVRGTVWSGGGAAPCSTIASKATNALR